MSTEVSYKDMDIQLEDVPIFSWFMIRGMDNTVFLLIRKNYGFRKVSAVKFPSGQMSVFNFWEIAHTVDVTLEVRR